MKREVATQLPEKVERIIKCELSSWQKVMYDQIKNKAVKKLSFGTG